MTFLTLLSAGIVYQLAPGTVQNYAVNVRFSGYLPILGGRDANVQVKMGLTATGLPSEKPTELKSVSELNRFSVSMNDAELPFTLSNVKTFFPKTTISFLPSGVVQSTDAPDITMPVRLPGLDAKRLPEISYLPLQLPESLNPNDPPFHFERTFGGGVVKYELTVSKLDEKFIDYSIQLSQDSVVFESSQHIEQPSATGSKWEVHRHLKGSGTAKFNREVALFDFVEVNALEESEVREILTDVRTRRQLNTKLEIKRETPRPEGPSKVLLMPIVPVR